MRSFLRRLWNEVNLYPEAKFISRVPESEVKGNYRRKTKTTLSFSCSQVLKHKAGGTEEDDPMSSHCNPGAKNMDTWQKGPGGPPARQMASGRAGNLPFRRQPHSLELSLGSTRGPKSELRKRAGPEKTGASERSDHQFLVRTTN